MHVTRELQVALIKWNWRYENLRLRLHLRLHLCLQSNSAAFRSRMAVVL